MDNIILHISDLHVTLDKNLGGGKNSKINSFLTTDSNTENSMLFISTFIKFIKEEYNKCNIYLLITGDITNTGEIKEFKYAKLFLEKIITELDIKKGNILLIPGDHDICRRDIQNLVATDEPSPQEKINIEKFKNFSCFYNEILGKTFDSNKIIFDKLVVEEKIMMLGINSCSKIIIDNPLGSIPIEKFEKEFLQISNISNYKTIACWHHNFTSAYENTNNGQWESENRTSVLSKLEQLKINLIFTGNEHTNSSKEVLGGIIKTSDCGAFCSINDETTFKVYKININDDISLGNEIFGLVKDNNNDSRFHWDKRTNSRAVPKQPDFFELFKKKPKIIENIIELETTQPLVEIINQPVLQQEHINNSRKFYSNPEYSDKIYKIIRDKKLFHSGHFHWSETSRAHNWIDVSKLLENKDDLNFVKNAVVDLIEKFDLQNNCDLIIGLGYEGNIISTKASIKHNIPYTFLPYSYRYNEHHEFERNINFDNSQGKYKNVLIITDVVHDGRTLRKLIKERENDFFNNVDKITAISLIYTGHFDINTNILNYNYLTSIKDYKLEKDYNLENDYEVNNIEFYSISSLRAEKCPYGKNYKTECLIYRDELSCVNLFYEEEA